VAEGKIIPIPAGIHAERLYQTPEDSRTPARYSVVKILDGDYAGHRVIVQDQYLP